MALYNKNVTQDKDKFLRIPPSSERILPYNTYRNTNFYMDPRIKSEPEKDPFKKTFKSKDEVERIKVSPQLFTDEDRLKHDQARRKRELQERNDRLYNRNSIPAEHNQEYSDDDYYELKSKYEELLKKTNSN